MDRTKRRASNFDLIRLIAAAAVILSHSLLVVRGNAWWVAHPTEPLRQVGDDAVFVFFAVSGYLVTQSWRRDPQFGRYLGRRALRMLPGLLTAVIVTVLIVGLLATALSPGTYMRSPGTWTYLLNGSLAAGTDRLPGVFSTLPVAGEINGSLWTLRYEFLCYLVLPLVLVVALRQGARRVVLWLAVIAGVIASYLLAFQPDVPILGVDPLHIAGMLGQSGYKALPWFNLVGFFLAGACFELFRDVITMRRVVALVCVPLFIVASQLPVLHVLAVVSLCYGVLYFATTATPVLGWVTRRGDVSYGVYLYGFPIEQLVVSVVGITWFPVVFAVSLPVAYIVGMASWRLVERRALALRPRASPARTSPSRTASEPGAQVAAPQLTLHPAPPASI